MERDNRLVEVSEEEFCINFELNSKCRADVLLKSLAGTAPVAFKVQTSSPHKFLVNPPSGLIPPLSCATCQIILKPQSQLPPTYPRCPSDRFLIKTALAPEFSLHSPESTRSHAINSWFSSHHFPTQDIKLKLAYVGPALLVHAASCGNVNAVRNLVKRQKTVVSEMSSEEAESLFRVASESPRNSNEVINLLIEAGLRIDGQGNGCSEMESIWASKGWTKIHVAAAYDRTDEVSSVIEEMGKCGRLDCRDKEGRTALYLAASKGYLRCARMLVDAGADVDVIADGKDGQTALSRAVMNGDRRMVETLIQAGADPTICSTMDLAKERGLRDLVKILERGEAVLSCARQGDTASLKDLLQKGGTTNFRDQYGFTASHVAAIKGHKDVMSVLIEHGADVECEDNEGHSPLHLAVEGGDVEMVKILINRGTNVNAMTKRGATPLYLARAMGYDAICQLLLNRGQ